MKEFNFIFTKDEVVDYYTYLLSSQKSNRLKQVFFIFSIPLLILLTIVFFKLDYIIVKIIATVLSIVWIMIIAPRFWKSYIRANIGEEFLKKNNITKFENVNVKVDDDYMIVNGVRYDISSEVKIVKTKLVTIFFFKESPVAIPNRFLNK